MHRQRIGIHTELVDTCFADEVIGTCPKTLLDLVLEQSVCDVDVVACELDLPLQGCPGEPAMVGYELQVEVGYPCTRLAVARGRVGHVTST